MSWPWPGAGPRVRTEMHYDGRRMTCFADRPPHLDALLRRAAADFPDADALVSDDRRMSYASLDESVERVAGNLAARGVAKGDRVAILCGNNVEFVQANLACARLGAIAVPMNVRQRRPESEYAVGHCGAKALIFDANLADQLPRPETVPMLRHRFAVGGGAPDARPFEDLLAPARAPAAQIAEEDVATILYTSGTTGRPKGAMLTHFGHIHSVLHFEVCDGLHRGRERTILCVPGSHVTGLTAVILTMIHVAGCIVLMREFKVDSFLDLAARERLTVNIMVPAMYNLCLLHPRFENHDLSSWRIGGFGGAPMPTATIAALARRLPRLTLMNGYGATETTSPTATMPPGHTAGREDSVGRVVPCGEVKVVDDDGCPVPPGESGELWIAGPMVVPGYWDNPEANAANFADGFWKSGDIGSIDAEGYVRIFDRKKDMINRGGYKVYSAEVENVLSHHPDVLEVGVVARPDPVLGEKVQVFVVPKRAGLEPESLRAFCAERLSDYKVPDFITCLDALPRNPNGKILKPALRALVEAELENERREVSA